MSMLQFARLPLAALLLFAGLPRTYAQNAPAPLNPDEQSQILKTAHAALYDLHAAGVKAYACDVDPDWPNFFVSVLGRSVSANDPEMKAVRSTRIHMASDLGTHLTVTYMVSPDVNANRRKTLDPLLESTKGFLQSFLETWTPSLNGAWIPLSGASVTRQENGFLVTYRTDDAQMRVRLDRDLHIVRITKSSPDSISEMQPTFTSTPQGLILTALQSDVREPPADAPVRVLMKTRFALVDGVQLPAAIELALTPTVSSKARFFNCHVQR